MKSPLLQNFTLTLSSYASAIRVGVIERRHEIGPFIRAARRVVIARRGPPGGWPNELTARVCEWLARHPRLYRAIITHADRSQAPLASGGDGTEIFRLAEYFRVVIACELRGDAGAVRFIGCERLAGVDWDAVAEWFFVHTRHPQDLREPGGETT